MNRRIAAWTIAAVAVLGLTACSGSPSTSDGASDTDDTSSSAPAETNTDQSVADACAIVSAKVTDATASLSGLDMTAAAADPQATVDQFSETVDAIGEAVDSVDNAEVKDATNAIFEDFTAMRDSLSKLLVEQDTSTEAISAATATITAVQESTTAFTELCTA